MSYVSLRTRGVSGYRGVGMAGLSRALGLGSLPGFVDYYPGGQYRSDAPSDPTMVLGAISEAVYDVVSQFLYIMGADPGGGDTCDTCRAGRKAINAYFLGLVSPDDVTSGNASKINAAANQTAKYFLNLFGGKPRGATGVASGDLAGNCNAYILGPTAPLWRSQIQASVVWQKATRCAQLSALMNGSGLDFLQVALGGDGMGGSMPTPPPVQASATGLPAGTVAQAPSYGVATPAPNTDATGNVIKAALSTPGTTYPVTPLSYGTIVSSDPATPAPPVPNVPTYTPSSAPNTIAAILGGGSAAPSTPAQTTYNNYYSYPSAASSSPGAAGSPATSTAAASSGILDGITSWIGSNPLIALGGAAVLVFMFSQGGRR